MIKQIPLSLFHLQDLIFKDRKRRQDSGESRGWITLDGQEDFALDQCLGPNWLYSSQTLAIYLLADFWSLLTKLPWRRWLTRWFHLHQDTSQDWKSSSGLEDWVPVYKKILIGRFESVYSKIDGERMQYPLCISLYLKMRNSRWCTSNIWFNQL